MRTFLYGGLVLLLSTVSLQGQTSFNPALREVDSLNVLLRQAVTAEEKLRGYGELCLAYANTVGNVALARLYADSVRLCAEKCNDASARASLDYYLGVICRFDGKYTEAMDHFEKYTDHGARTNDSVALAKGFYSMAVLHTHLGNYEEGLAMNYRVINICEKKKSMYELGSAYISLGNLFVYMKKYGDAIEAYNKSLVALDNLETTFHVRMSKLRILINLGNVYEKLGQYDKARKFFDESLHMSRVLGSSRTEGTCLSSIAEILSSQKRYDSALVYNLKALALREKTTQNDKILLTLLRVGEVYRHLKKYTLAEQYLLRTEDMALRMKAKPELRDSYKGLSELHAIQGEFQKAYHYHQQYAAVKDSVLNVQTTKRFNELQAKYEAGEKDKRIELLAKERELQEKEVQRQTTFKWALMGGLIMVILFGGALLYLLYKGWQNQKIIAAKNVEVQEAKFKQQVGELEMKALRAQINPHFLFNCMNSINRMILNGENTNASLYLTKFSKLIRLILENAESETVPLENEIALLESYLQLESLRFKGKIDYALVVDNSIDPENTYVPSMVIQPFVENAIWHGLMHKDDDTKGHISIRMSKENDRLLCTIEDNGVGREKAELLRENSLFKNKSMGMKITKERLRLMTKDQWDQTIRIVDLKDEDARALGTRVEIVVPVT